ncbi:MAG: IS200/IS605 family accessory protein TnpB-related protein [Coleofasciculus sp. F4-SAH-05]
MVNEGWKQEVNLGKGHNQKFVNIPHAKLIDQITYKCELIGIKVVIQEESYTSKTSALDLEAPYRQNQNISCCIHIPTLLLQPFARHENKGDHSPKNWLF